jgi:predicted RNase H-like nuclease
VEACDPGEVRWLGLDGARGGWAAAGIADDGRGTLQIVDRVGAALARWPRVERVLVDMPVGLPHDARRRRCDTLARALLPGRRGAAVFSPPCRRALAAADHAEASRINRQVTGRGLSIQAWNLAPRIREVDALLEARPELVGVVVEAHPEVVFHRLAGFDEPRSEPLPPKRTPPGRRVRRTLLERALPGSGDLLDRVRVPRRVAGADDWIDALVLAALLHRAQGDVELLPDPPDRDARGLPMALAVPRTPAVDATYR